MFATAKFIRAETVRDETCRSLREPVIAAVDVINANAAWAAAILTEKST